MLRQSSAFFPAALRYSALPTGSKVKTVARWRGSCHATSVKRRRHSPSGTPSSAAASGSDARSAAVASTVRAPSIARASCAKHASRRRSRPAVQILPWSVEAAGTLLSCCHKKEGCPPGVRPRPMHRGAAPSVVRLLGFAGLSPTYETYQFPAAAGRQSLLRARTGRRPSFAPHSA